MVLFALMSVIAAANSIYGTHQPRSIKTLAETDFDQFKATTLNSCCPSLVEFPVFFSHATHAHML
jgi:hypothetical protein